jgi:CRISPR-associated endonuclease/helicase Cas3
VDFADFFGQATDGRAPFAWQSVLAESPDLPQLVRVPTGAGKTEGAVLGWLWRRRFADAATRVATPRRLAYCLPMRVLVEQTVERCQEMVDRLGLTDHVRTHQLMGGAVAKDWKDRPEDDQILVGTLDQLLSRALMRGYGVSRYQWPIDFALLHNDVMWVYDEVQLFGEALATSTQLEGFRQALPSGLGPSVSLWMSATVDPEWLGTVDHPVPERLLGLSADDRTGVLATRLAAVKRVAEVEVIDADTVISGHRAGTLTLVVLNTVKTARELHGKLKRSKMLDDAELVMLHSRFRPDDRRRAVDRLRAPIDSKGPGRIVVSTQVIEAGVDISAALLMTEAAPWASLVQRFGRCNRFGEHTDAVVNWAPPAKPLPYEADEVDAAVKTLRAIEGGGVGPDDLEHVDAPLKMPPRRFVIRRRDFLGLFDTAPDLTGLDLDVSRFIRDGDDLTVSLAWRDLNNQPPDKDTAELRAAELCPVTLSEMRDLLKQKNAPAIWRFDTVDAQWARIGPQDIRPGVRLLTDVSTGNYTPDGGFDLSATAPPTPVAGPADDVPEGVDGDSAAELTGSWLTLREHTEGVCSDLDALLSQVVGLDDYEDGSLRMAAQLHDWGKAHEVFQSAMHAATALAGPPSEIGPNVILAKRVGRAPRYSRPGFRHELASTLAYLATHEDPDPLVTYLVAAHHGRVRLGARAIPQEAAGHSSQPTVLGCATGDTLPEVQLDGATLCSLVTLNLTPLELGADVGETYTDMALDLLERLGPIRLAFLEAILRTADVRRSRLEEVEARP